MTADGYIDINLQLNLKLLIEAISCSKLLVNTGCTIVKYMERNIRILRDIAASTDRAQIAALFDNQACTALS